MRKDKLTAELIFLLLLFFVLFLFSSEITSFFDRLESSFDIKPVRSFFWFLSQLFSWLGNWLFSTISYMIVAGVIYLFERRIH